MNKKGILRCCGNLRFLRLLALLRLRALVRLIALTCFALFAQAQTTKTPFYPPEPRDYWLYYSPKMEDGLLTDSAAYKGFINKDGKTILATEYDNIKTICDDFMVYKNAKCGVVTPEGREVLPAIYDTIYKRTGKYWFMKIGGFWGYKNNETGFVQIPIYDKLRFGGFEQNKKIWYKKGRKYGFISANDVVESPNYESLVYQNYVLPCVNGMRDCYFADLPNFENLVFAAQKGKKMGLVGIDNNELLSFKYDSVQTFLSDFQYYKTNERAYYKVKKGKKYGILYYDYATKKTKTVIPIQYDKITFLKHTPKTESKYLFILKKGKKQGIMTIENIVFEPFRRQIIEVYDFDIVITTLDDTKKAPTN